MNKSGGTSTRCSVSNITSYENFVIISMRIEWLLTMEAGLRRSWHLSILVVSLISMNGDRGGGGLHRRLFL